MSWIDILFRFITIIFPLVIGLGIGMAIGIKRERKAPPKEPAGTVYVFYDPESPEHPGLYLDLKSIDHLKDDWVIFAIDRHSQK